MNDNNINDPLDEIISNLEKIHSQSVETATHFGYALRVFDSMKQKWGNLSETNLNDEAAILYGDNLAYLNALSTELSFFPQISERLLDISVYTSGSAEYFANTTTTTDAFSTGDLVAYSPDEQLIVRSPNRQRLYGEKFNKIDEALGKTYQGIWEAMYATKSEPERTALFLIRQAFDHFFGKLAPDHEVLQSPSWSPKDKKENDEIWRSERIDFVAHKYIKDDNRRNTTLAKLQNMLSVYDALNGAHKRGELNKRKAVSALQQMATFLENWIDVLELDNSL